MKKVCTQVMTMDLFVDSMMVLRITMVISLHMQVILSQEIDHRMDRSVKRRNCNGYRVGTL